MHDLRRKVDAAFHDEDEIALRATVMSFGFKYGIPVDADYVADVAVPAQPVLGSRSSGALNGRDGSVNDYVVAQPGRPGVPRPVTPR